ELEDDRAVLQLLVDVARLARPGEAREARAAGAHAPRGHGHAEGLGAPDQVLDVPPAAAQHAAQVLVVLVEPGLGLAVVLGDEAAADLEVRRHGDTSIASAGSRPEDRRRPG